MSDDTEKAAPPEEKAGEKSEAASATKEAPPGDAVQPGGSPPPPPKLSLKVDGQVIEVTQEEAIRYAQMGLGSQKRFAEAARKEKDAQLLLDTLTKDPDFKKRAQVLEQSFIAQAGDQSRGKRLYHDFLATNLAAMLEENALSEDELASRERNRALEEKERRLHEKEQEFSKQIEEQEVKRFREEIDRDLPQAAKRVGLPEDPATLQRILTQAIAYEDAGVEITLDQVAQEVKIQRELAGRDHVSKLSPEDFETKYPEAYKRVIDHYTKKVRANAQGASTQRASTPSRGESSGRSGQTKPESRSEIEARIASRLSQG